jgi:hypothetical protein
VSGKWAHRTAAATASRLMPESDDPQPAGEAVDPAHVGPLN